MGVQHLTHLFNISLRDANFPSIRKSAKYRPYPQDRQASIGKHFFEANLSSLPCCKCAGETRTSYTEFLRFLASRTHSTASLIFDPLPLPFSRWLQIATGMNQRKSLPRILASAMDFSVALNSVSHHGLMEMIRRLNLLKNLVRWLASYLGRLSACL